MPIAPEIIESVANSNMKNVAEAPAFYSGLAMADAIDHRRAMQQITLASTGAIVNKLTNLDAAEALAVQKVASGNDVSQQLSALLAALNSGNQGVKAAVNTPPTGTGG